MKKYTQEEINFHGKSLQGVLSKIADEYRDKGFPVAIAFCILPDQQVDQNDRAGFHGGMMRWSDYDEDRFVDVIKYAIDGVKNCPNTFGKKSK